MRFGKALLGFDVDDVEENVPRSGSGELWPGVSCVIVLEQIGLCDPSKECASLACEVVGLF